MIKLNIDELRKKTMEHFGINDPKDVEFITEDYIKLDFQEIGENPERYEWDSLSNSLQTSYYCHNVSYDTHFYYFEHGGGSHGSACSHQFAARAPKNLWTHHNLGQNCSHGGGQHSQIVLLRMR